MQIYITRLKIKLYLNLYNEKAILQTISLCSDDCDYRNFVWYYDISSNRKIINLSIYIILLFIWGIPSTYFRSKFRKIVYQTDDWRINIKPIFFKEIKALFFNLYPKNKEYIKIRNYYRMYLVVYLVLFLIYYFKK